MQIIIFGLFYRSTDTWHLVCKKFQIFYPNPSYKIVNWAIEALGRRNLSHDQRSELVNLRYKFEIQTSTLYRFA